MTAFLVIGQVAVAFAQQSLTAKAIEIGRTSQLFVDNYIVDNTWTLKYKTQHIDRIFHQPRKHSANPLITVQLEWLSQRQNDSAAGSAARQIEAAVSKVLQHGSMRTADIGGCRSTTDVAQAVIEAL